MKVSEIYIGQKINHWTVLFKTSSVGKGSTKFLCRCDCGLEKEVFAKHLASGASTKCRKCTFSGSHSPLFGGYGEISSKKWKKLKKDADTRSLEFSITIEEAWQKFLEQDGRCALTGLKLSHPKNINTKWTGTASLDRINSELGYVPGNIQWIHKTVNRMKGNLQEEEFIDLCNLVATYKP